MALARRNERNMSKRYFPVFIDLSQKRIIVIGGGTIATRRVNTLLQFTENVTVISPEVTDELRELSVQDKIVWRQCEYCEEQIRTADIVIAATNQPKVNHRVKKDCEQMKEKDGRNILVNIADDKNLCDFYFPGIVDMDGVVVGINSGGKNPGHVKEIRKRIQNMIKNSQI